MHEQFRQRRVVGPREEPAVRPPDERGGGGRQHERQDNLSEARWAEEGDWDHLTRYRWIDAPRVAGATLRCDAEPRYDKDRFRGADLNGRLTASGRTAFSPVRTLGC